MSKIINLFTEGKTITKDKREFTRVLGGFDNNNPIITDLQVSKLLGYSKGARSVRQLLSNENNEGKKNIDNFEFGLDILDLKDVLDQDNNLEILKQLGYTNMSISKAKNIYIFSESGLLLFLKFAEGEKAVELYKDFIEDYFKTKAENKILKVTLQEQIDQQYELYDSIFGKAIRKNDKNLFIEAEKIMNNIIDLEKKLTEEVTTEKYKEVENKYNKFLDTTSTYTFTDTCKIISTIAKDEKSDIKISSRKLTEFLRNQGVLSKNKHGNNYTNLPNKKYEDYFNVTSIDTGKGFNKTQTKVKPKGVEFIYDLLKENA